MAFFLDTKKEIIYIVVNTKKNNIASVFATEGNYIAANNIYHQLYESSFKRMDYGELQEISYNLYFTYQSLNELDSALVYHIQYKSYSDSINKISDTKLIENLIAVHEKDQAEKDHVIEILDIKNNLMNERYKYRSVGAGLVILLLFIIILYIRQRQKNEILKVQKESENKILSEELDNKKKELTTNVMYLLKKNEFISALSSKLNELSPNLKQENISSVQNIIREINMNTSGDSWKEFEIRFQEVYTGFYNKLNKEFPTLTPNELRLCAFLKLNMSTKEISAITYQSVQTLKVARYRLRKKLNISEDENLVSFFTKF